MCRNFALTASFPPGAPTADDLGAAANLQQTSARERGAWIRWGPLIGAQASLLRTRFGNAESDLSFADCGARPTSESAARQWSVLLRVRGPNGRHQPRQARGHSSPNPNAATASGQGSACCGTTNGRLHPAGTKMAPHRRFGASPPPSWKECDSSAVLKKQLEFLACTQAEQKVHVEVQNTLVGRASD